MDDPHSNETTETSARRSRPWRFRSRLRGAALSNWYGDRLRRRLYAHLSLRFELYGLNLKDTRIASTIAGQPLDGGAWSTAVRIVAVDLGQTHGPVAEALLQATDEVLQPFRRWCRQRKASSTARLRVEPAADLHVTLFALGTESEPRPLFFARSSSDEAVVHVNRVVDREDEMSDSSSSGDESEEPVVLGIEAEKASLEREVRLLEQMLKKFEVCRWSQWSDLWSENVPAEPKLRLDRILITETGVVLASWRVARPWTVNIDALRLHLRQELPWAPNGQTELILHTTLARILLRRTQIPPMLRRKMQGAASAASERLSSLEVPLSKLVHIVLTRRMSGEGTRRAINVRLGSIAFFTWMKTSLNAAWHGDGLSWMSKRPLLRNSFLACAGLACLMIVRSRVSQWSKKT